MTKLFNDKLLHMLPIEQSDIIYTLINTKKYRPDGLREADYDALYKKIITEAQNEVGDTYGAVFHEDIDTLIAQNNKIYYFLFGLVDPFKIGEHLRKQYAHAKKMPNSRVNRAMIFEQEKYQEAADIIKELDKTLKVNTIYQDTIVSINGKPYVTISSVDAADNMVCETFRVKYKTILKDDAKYAIPFYRYGVSESGHRFADELLKNGRAADGINIHGKGRGFIILEHGLVRMGVQLSHFEDILQNFNLKQ